MLDFLQKLGRQTSKSDKWVFGLVFVFGLVGLIASFVLSIEEFTLLKDPNAALSCSFNLVLNCSTVMQTWQASLLGFPNMFIGLMAFPVIMVVGVIGLSGVKLRWFYNAANFGLLVCAIFSYWLFFNSLYLIEALCPWCLTVTFSSTILIAAITYYSLRENNFGLSVKSNKKVQKFLNGGYYQLIFASWIILMIALVFIKFGESLFA
jgi:uncharacterized membrane protein